MALEQLSRLSRCMQAAEWSWLLLSSHLAGRRIDHCSMLQPVAVPTACLACLAVWQWSTIPYMHAALLAWHILRV